MSSSLFKVDPTAFRPDIALPTLTLNALAKMAGGGCTEWISEKACPANAIVPLVLETEEGPVEVMVRLCDVLHEISYMLNIEEDDEDEEEQLID